VVTVRVPVARSNGIGTTLMQAAEALPQARGHAVVTLGVEGDNPRARLGAPVPSPGVWMRKELA
jgi:GNAT superfamily N-acetyltransferase